MFYSTLSSEPVICEKLLEGRKYYETIYLLFNLQRSANWKKKNQNKAIRSLQKLSILKKKIIKFFGRMI